MKESVAKGRDHLLMPRGNLHKFTQNIVVEFTDLYTQKRAAYHSTMKTLLIIPLLLSLISFPG